MRRPISADAHTYPVDFPDKCPICHRFGDIQAVKASLVQEGKSVEVVFRCPFPPCSRFFVGRYGRPASTEIEQLIPVVSVLPDFPPTISILSPLFVSIYQEAEEARQLGLKQVSGPGYRKAFEFLVKDYAKSVTPTDRHAEIEKTFSGNVVSAFIGDPRIAAVATRALWLGNDETHYLRRWEDKDVDDLIALIRLTIAWVEIERLSAKYTTEMPE